MLLHCSPMAGFIANSWARVREYLVRMALQVSPDATWWNLLQEGVMFSWMGVGVGMPLSGRVEEVVMEEAVVVMGVTGVMPQFFSMQYERPMVRVQVPEGEKFCGVAWSVRCRGWGAR